jgi:Flp pilus assembly pilin Flp
MYLTSRHSCNATARRPQRMKRERGAAAVEFALVASVLCLLLFGIIEFGVILSVKSSVTQAASEGARAAVNQLWCPSGSTCTYPDNDGIPSLCRNKTVTGPDYSCLYGAAADQASKTMSWLSTCSDNTDGTPVSATASVQCTSTAYYCNGADLSAGLCISTKVVYDYKDNPLFPNIPLLSAFIPSAVPSQTVVRINPCTAPTTSGGTPNCG